MAGAGHLFVIDGDLMKLHCDAILVPVDSNLWATETWAHLLGFVGPVPDLDIPEGWGTSVRAVRYRAADDEPEIWLGDIGNWGADDSWFADGLAEFVERAASARPGVRLRLAVNVAGSGAGGSAHDKGHLFTTIVPALIDAADRTSCDVTLVCWGRKAYAAAQRARARLGVRHFGQDDRGTRLREKAAELAECARRSELVLFIGAGVSMGAGLRSWQGLLDGLREKVTRPLPDDDRITALDVRDQAHLISRHFDSPEEYQRAFASLLEGSRYALAHGLLASLRTREAVTTNYDALYELASSTDGRSCAVLPYEPVVRQDRWLLKLHGSVDRPDEMVLTRGDYLGLPARAGALFGVLQAMLMTRHMLFVGYSLTDDTFHKVMHEVRQARVGATDRVGTALVLFDDPLLEELWGADLEIVSMAERPQAAPSSVDVTEAARTLDIFLDLVGLLAADVTGFLLDPTYASMLDDEERRLASLFDRVTGELANSSGPVAALLKTKLSGLGR